MFEITEREFKQLACFIKDNYGINLKEEKRLLLVGRLSNVLLEAGFKSFSEYYEYIISDKTGEAVITLVDKITTNHTFFMREAVHFSYFRDLVLPFLDSTIKDKDLRLWCAACSTGEEAYTLAMIVDDFFGPEKYRWDTKILATDISETALRHAKRAVYSKERISPLPAHWKAKHFMMYDSENYIVADKIRKEVIYRKLNLMDNIFPFSKKFHVIFCRNVMIYFDDETKDELVNKLYNHMETGGFLFIGHSESLNKEATKFHYIMPAVYRK